MRLPAIHFVRVTCLFIILLPINGAHAEDWEHWRGPQRNDVTSEASGWSGDPSSWPGESIWEINVGEGSSSPIVYRDRVYTIGWRDGHDVLMCWHADTGKPLWEKSYAAPQYARHATGDEGLYSGVTATPELDTSTALIYTLGPDGNLNCWDTRRDGTKVWGLNLYDNFGIGQRPRIGRQGLRDYGFTTAPLVHKDLLIVEVGDDEGNLMAFDKRTGSRIWTSQSKGYAGHSGGPALMNVQGIPCVAAFTLRHLLVARLDASNAGKTVAEYPWETDFSQNIVSPAVHDDTVLITAAYNHHSMHKLKITLRGVQKQWEAPYSSGICTPIIHDGYVYWSSQTFHCLDFATGERVWHGGSFGDAGSCILTADKRLIVWGKRGKLALIETAEQSPNQYRELCVRDHILDSDVWPHVVLADKKLFCKDRSGNLKCFSNR